MLKLQENLKKDPSCKVIKQHLKNHNTFTFRHITLNEIKKVIHDFFKKNMAVGGEIPVDSSAAVKIAAVFGVLKHVNC